MLDPEALKERMRYMTTLVYPTIEEKSKTVRHKQGKAFIKKNLIITNQFPPGAHVMVKDVLRTSKMEPRYTGPFSVIRRNRGGVYYLRGDDGTVYTRTADHLKLCSLPEPAHILEAETPEEDALIAEVQKVLSDKKNEDGTSSYLVKWKNRAATLNQWVHEADFQNLRPIQQYHKANMAKTQSPLKSALKKRKISE
jgi:hypothetical protein